MRGHKGNAAGLDGFDGLLSQRLGFHEPLGGDERLNHRFAARALGNVKRVILHLHQQALLFEMSDHLAASFKAIETGEATGGFGHDAGVANDLDFRQIVPAAGFEIVGIVAGRDFHRAGAELRVGQLVDNDRNFPIHQG